MLNTSEKKYLWSKIETNKKKRAIENENNVFKLLNTNIEVSVDDFIEILNSLEYTFKKKLKECDVNNEIFKSIQKKLPTEWLGVKYSNLKQQKQKLSKTPTINSPKKEIIEYLSKNNIKYLDNMKKSELLELFENKNILTFYGFNKLF